MALPRFLKKVMRTNWSPEFSNYKIKFDTLLAPALLSKPKISRYSAPLTLAAGTVFFELVRATAVRFHRVVHFFIVGTSSASAGGVFFFCRLRLLRQKLLRVLHSAAFDPSLVAFAVSL